MYYSLEAKMIRSKTNVYEPDTIINSIAINPDPTVIKTMEIIKTNLCQVMDDIQSVSTTYKLEVLLFKKEILFLDKNVDCIISAKNRRWR